MAMYNVNPVREQIRSEILAALADGAAMSAAELYDHCPSATESSEIARIAHEMRRTNLLETGDQVIHALGMRVNTYKLPTAEDPRIAAAKPIKVERKIPRTIKPPKPAPDHPFKARIVAQEAHDGAPRVTRPLPMHLQSTAPRDAFPAVSPVAQTTTAPYHHILETAMSEDPLQYIPNPDAFTMEPSEPEAEHDIDDELTSLLSEVAALKPTDDAMMQASEYVGDLTDAMARRREELTRTGVLTETPKVCQCLRINSLPPLPKGYIYGGIKVWIESEHDVGRLTIATHDEGGGAFASIKASGRLSFDPGDLVAIGQVADALIKLHESMDKQNND